MTPTLIQTLLTITRRDICHFICFYTITAGALISLSISRETEFLIYVMCRRARADNLTI